MLDTSQVRLRWASTGRLRLSSYLPSRTQSRMDWEGTSEQIDSIVLDTRLVSCCVRLFLNDPFLHSANP